MSKYKTRPSPPFSAKDYPDETMKGNDGNIYISQKDKNGIYRWKLDNTNNNFSDSKTRVTKDNPKLPKNAYVIYHNGQYLYYVEILPEQLTIFVLDFIEYDDDEYPLFYNFKYFKSFSYIDYFIGKDKFRNYTGYSILARLSANKYMYIGHIIYTFTTTEEIIDYKLKMGNNDTLLAIAYTQDNVYLMLASVYFPKNLSINEYPYDSYYGHINTKKSNFGIGHVKGMKNLKIISEI